MRPVAASSPRSCNGNRRAERRAGLARTRAYWHRPRASSNTIGNVFAGAAAAPAPRCTGSARPGGGGGRVAVGIERQRRRAGKRRAHQRYRAEHVRPQQRAPGRDGRAEIVPDDCRRPSGSRARHQPERVAHQVEHAEAGEVAVVVGVPAGGAAIAALVRRDHVIARFRQRQHHFAPAVGEFGKAVQQQHAGPAVGVSKPASSTCMRRPLMPSTKRERMPGGGGCRGRVSVVIRRALRSSWWEARREARASGAPSRTMVACIAHPSRRVQGPLPGMTAVNSRWGKTLLWRYRWVQHTGIPGTSDEGNREAANVRPRIDIHPASGGTSAEALSGRPAPCCRCPCGRDGVADG